MSFVASRLSGTRLARADDRGADLILRLDGVVRFSVLGLSAFVICQDVTTIAGVNVRVPSITEALRTGGTVWAFRQGSGGLEFEVTYQTGPGEVDVHRFAIACQAVRVTWRPSVRGTLRAWSRL